MNHQRALLHSLGRVPPRSFVYRHGALCASLTLALGGCNAVLGLDEPTLKFDAGLDSSRDTGTDGRADGPRVEAGTGGGGSSGAGGAGGAQADSATDVGGTAGMSGAGGTIGGAAGVGGSTGGVGGATGGVGGAAGMGGAAGNGGTLDGSVGDADSTVDSGLAGPDGDTAIDGEADRAPMADAADAGPPDVSVDAQPDAAEAGDAPSDAAPEGSAPPPPFPCQYQKLQHFTHTTNWQVRGITAGKDGNLWTMETLEHTRTARIVRIAPTSTSSVNVTEYPIHTADSFGQDIVWGPDGKVWFTEPVAMRIGRLDPVTGIIDEFRLDKEGKSWPRWLAVGRDGNIWFARSCDQDDEKRTDNNPDNDGDNPFNGDSLGYITPTEIPAIKEFPVTTDGRQITNMVEGPDHKMWFTQQRRVCRMTMTGELAGQFACYDIPQPMFTTRFLSNFIGLAEGPDGNMWFTGGWADNKVGSLSVDGNWNAIELEPFGTNPLSSNSRLPMAITAAPDHNLYFVEYASAEMGRVNFAEGTVTHFPLSPHYEPIEIVVGPDGNIWLSEFGGVACFGLHPDVDASAP
jgi:streptogramin lyase